MAQGTFGFRLDYLLLFVAVVGIAIGGGGLFYNDTLARRHDAWITMARQLQTDSVSVNRIAEDVARGLAPDFADLTGQNENFDDSMRILREGDADIGIDPMPGAVRSEVGSVEQAWATMKTSLEGLIKAEPAVSQASSLIRELDENGVKLFELYQRVSQRLVSGGAGIDKLVPAAEQMARAERLRTLARQLLGDGRGADKIAAQIGSETAALAAAHESLLGAGPVGTYLGENSALIEQLAQNGKLAAEIGPALGEMQAAAGVLPGDGRNLYSTAISLEDALTPLAGSGSVARLATLPALGAAVVALLLYVLVNIISVRARVRRAEENDQRQQAAILSLLDEISTLADGDLTVRANVTADFTGAIADSVNSTVETLRNLVGTINQTASELGIAATSTRSIAAAMEFSSGEQAQEVVKIAGQITQSSDSLATVATRAEQLARQAGNSVDVAHNGASTVGRTIQGMSALREQIQDTAKRIKRLGESSQEIGNIIEFINDIAEQTNTLALNASIQAAMAGESGRGFAVVADEVQRLAERAAAATRQIETLVKTIQADTNEAIVSMERSTTNVISGARSAEEAGQALTRIEATSTELARLIQDISGEARVEAAQATRIAGQMQAIRDSALQGAESAQMTASAVEEINALSAKLRESVAGFKLPSEDEMALGS